MNWSEITAFLGGTFDPPHRGHLLAAEGLYKNPGVKEVILLPSCSPPQKPCQAGFEDRVEMLRLGFGEKWRIDLREALRGSPSYAFDTLIDLRRDFRDLAFVIGSDQLLNLPTWHRFPDILKLCHWIVLERKSENGQAVIPTLKSWKASGILKSESPAQWNIRGTDYLLKLVPTEAPLISSTQIRQAIGRTGLPPAGALSEPVLAYLNRKSLYGTQH